MLVANMVEIVVGMLKLMEPTIKVSSTRRGGGYHDGMGIFCFLANLWPACRSRVSRNFTKRLKDGEEQSNSPSQMEVSHAALVMLHLPSWLFVSLKYFYLFSPHINAFPIKPKSYIHCLKVNKSNLHGTYLGLVANLKLIPPFLVPIKGKCLIFSIFKPRK